MNLAAVDSCPRLEDYFVAEDNRILVEDSCWKETNLQMVDSHNELTVAVDFDYRGAGLGYFAEDSDRTEAG